LTRKRNQTQSNNITIVSCATFPLSPQPDTHTLCNVSEKKMSFAKVFRICRKDSDDVFATVRRDILPTTSTASATHTCFSVFQGSNYDIKKGAVLLYRARGCFTTPDYEVCTGTGDRVAVVSVSTQGAAALADALKVNALVPASTASRDSTDSTPAASSSPLPSPSPSTSPSPSPSPSPSRSSQGNDDSASFLQTRQSSHGNGDRTSLNSRFIFQTRSLGSRRSSSGAASGNGRRRSSKRTKKAQAVDATLDVRLADGVDAVLLLTVCLVFSASPAV
jgi:hypothetical protein